MIMIAYCPYCGDKKLTEETDGTYYCPTCLSIFGIIEYEFDSCVK